MTAQFPALVVVVPLLAGPLVMLARRPAPSWLLAFAASAATLVLSALLTVQVHAGGPIRYAMGGFAPPIGIEFRIDAASTFLLLIVSAISTVVLAGARASVESEVLRERIHLFYAAWMLCLAGLVGIVATGDAFNLFVFLEISSLATYAMVAAGSDRRALLAAFQYLVMGTIGATFYLIGVAALYSATGTLNMADLAARVEPLMELRAVKMAFAFMAVGLSLKLALFPLHLWLPGAYACAPSTVSAFLAGTATKVAAYALLRAIYGIFGTQIAFDVMSVGPVLLVVSVLALFVASTVAIFQTDVKRLLAYSSVAQVGYIMLGASFGSAGPLGAGLLHLFNHALIKTTLFMVLAATALRGLPPTLEGLRGSGRHMPWTLAALVVGALSLIGIPLTAGFTSKWQLVSEALGAGQGALVGVIVASSLLAVVYVWRIVEAAYFGARPADAPPLREAPPALLAVLWLLVLGNLYFGVDTTLNLGMAREAADALVRGLR